MEMSITVKRLLEIKKEWGLSYDQMEKASKLGQSVITKICEGRSSPSVWTVVRICDAYQISVDWMLGLTEDRGAREKWKRTGTKEAMEKTLSRNLRTALWNKGFEIPEFAKVSGISENTIYNHVKAEASPWADKLTLYCKHLDISADWLLGRRDER